MELISSGKIIMWGYSQFLCTFWRCRTFVSSVLKDSFHLKTKLSLTSTRSSSLRDGRERILILGFYSVTSYVSRLWRWPLSPARICRYGFSLKWGRRNIFKYLITKFKTAIRRFRVVKVCVFLINRGGLSEIFAGLTIV